MGLTRAKRRAKVFFATNRRIHGSWQTTIPSRFVDELPETHVEVTEAARATRYGGYGRSRFDTMAAFSASSYETPGWQRAQRGAAARGFSEPKHPPREIEGELVAKATVASGFRAGARVFHQKFGGGLVASVEGNKLTVDFDHAGRKMVLESFVTAA